MTFELQFSLAKVLKVKRNKSARIPSFLLELDVGMELLKDHPKPFYCSSAQITDNYEEQDLTGLFLLTLLNFPRKQIGSHMSDCLVTAVQSSSCADVETKRKSNILVTAKSFVVDDAVSLSPGCIVSFEDYSEECRMQDSHWVTNQRDLTWDRFLSFDIRVGTIGTEGESERNLYIDFGPENFSPIPWTERLSNLVGKQALFLLGKGDYPYLLATSSGHHYLTPERPVSNGFKLA